MGSSAYTHRLFQIHCAIKFIIREDRTGNCTIYADWRRNRSPDRLQLGISVRVCKKNARYGYLYIGKRLSLRFRMMAEDCRIHERKPERADIFSILYGVPFSNGFQ